MFSQASICSQSEGEGQYSDLSPSCYRHLVAITRDLFKVVHLGTYTPQLILTYIDLVVATESGQYTSNWNADLYFLVPSLKLFYHCLQKIIFKFMKITGAV